MYGNSYKARLEVHGNNIKFDVFFGTKKSNPQEPTEQEVEKAFKSAVKYAREGNNLTLLNKQNKPVVELSK